MRVEGPPHEWGRNGAGVGRGGGRGARPTIRNKVWSTTPKLVERAGHTRTQATIHGTAVSRRSRRGGAVQAPKHPPA